MLLILLNQDPLSKATWLNAKEFLVERATSVKCCPALSMGLEGQQWLIYTTIKHVVQPLFKPLKLHMNTLYVHSGWPKKKPGRIGTFVIHRQMMRRLLHFFTTVFIKQLWTQSGPNGVCCPRNTCRSNVRRQPCLEKFRAFSWNKLKAPQMKSKPIGTFLRSV